MPDCGSNLLQAAGCKRHTIQLNAAGVRGVYSTGVRWVSLHVSLDVSWLRMVSLCVPACPPTLPAHPSLRPAACLAAVTETESDSGSLVLLQMAGGSAACMQYCRLG